MGMPITIRKNTPSGFEPPDELRGVTPNSLTTTQLPDLDSRVPRSSTKLLRNGLNIVAYPSMRVVATFSDEDSLEETFDRMAAQLAAFRLDLLRPYGTCPRCALPNPEDASTHVCP